MPETEPYTPGQVVLESLPNVFRFRAFQRVPAPLLTLTVQEEGNAGMPSFTVTVCEEEGKVKFRSNWQGAMRFVVGHTSAPRLTELYHRCKASQPDTPETPASATFLLDTATGHVLCQMHVERAQKSGAELATLTPADGPCAICALRVVASQGPSWAPQDQRQSYASEADWRKEAVRRFGPDPMGWRFVCPCCEHKATVADYKAAGAPTGAVAFSCVGRWLGAKAAARDAFGGKGPGPCNYTGGGLINLNPIKVMLDKGGEMFAFAFAEPE